MLGFVGCSVVGFEVFGALEGYLGVLYDLGADDFAEVGLLLQVFFIAETCM